MKHFNSILEVWFFFFLTLCSLESQKKINYSEMYELERVFLVLALIRISKLDKNEIGTRKWKLLMFYWTMWKEKVLFFFRLQPQKCMVDQTSWVAKIVNNVSRDYYFYKQKAKLCLVVTLRLKLRIAEKFTIELLGHWYFFPYFEGRFEICIKSAKGFY